MEPSESCSRPAIAGPVSRGGATTASTAKEWAPSSSSHRLGTAGVGGGAQRDAALGQRRADRGAGILAERRSGEASAVTTVISLARRSTAAMIASS